MYCFSLKYICYTEAYSETTDLHISGLIMYGDRFVNVRRKMVLIWEGRSEWPKENINILAIFLQQ